MTLNSAQDLFRLDGAVAIVTGASSGIGVDIAIALASSGADIVLAARRTELLAQTEAKIVAVGQKCLSVQTDVSMSDQCDALVAAAVNHFGHVDVLVNNAGTGTAVPAVREAPEEFRRVVDLNLNGTFYMSQATAKVMGPGSAIVNISSALALTTAGLPQAAYASSKAAVLGLTRDLAQQWTPRRGIRVNAVAPGFVATEMTSTFPEGYMESQVSRFPISRAGTTTEIASAVLFLASPAASYITGTTLSVDGGMAIS